MTSTRVQEPAQVEQVAEAPIANVEHDVSQEVALELQRAADQLLLERAPNPFDVSTLNERLLQAAQTPSQKVADVFLRLATHDASSNWVDSSNRTTKQVAVEALLKMGYPYAFQLTPELLSYLPHPGPEQRPWASLLLSGIAVPWLGGMTATLALQVARDPAWVEGGSVHLWPALGLGSVGLGLLHAIASAALARDHVRRAPLRALVSVGLGLFSLGMVPVAVLATGWRTALLAWAPTLALTVSAWFRQRKAY